MAAADEKIWIIRNDISISQCTLRITRMIPGVLTGADQAAAADGRSREETRGSSRC
jgi:hypothetical protein